MQTSTARSFREIDTSNRAGASNLASRALIHQCELLAFIAASAGRQVAASCMQFWHQTIVVGEFPKCTIVEADMTRNKFVDLFLRGQQQITIAIKILKSCDRPILDEQHPQFGTRECELHFVAGNEEQSWQPRCTSSLVDLSQKRYERDEKCFKLYQVP